MGRLRGFTFFLCGLQISLFAKPLEVQIETPYAILINSQTGQVLYDKKSKEKVYPASTTKVASLLYVLRECGDRLDEVITCSDNALRVVSEEVKKSKGDELPPYILESDGTSMRLRKYEKVPLRDLLYGMILASGNDASNVAAEYISGDIPTFVKNVNEMAIGLGCVNTHFSNPHGLFHRDHQTCAYDMAIFAKEALKYPLFREIIKTPLYEKPGRALFLSNALLKPDSPYYYPFAIGIKTGYVRMAKYNLVAAANNGEREVIAVLHKSPTSKQRYIDAIALFEAAFSEMKVQRLMFPKAETVFEREIPKAKAKIIARLKDDFYLKYYPSEEEEVIPRLDWDHLELPIEQGARVAVLSLLSKRDGRLLKSEILVAEAKVNKKLCYFIFDSGKLYFLPVILPVLLLTGVVGLVLLVKRKAE